MLIAHAGRGVQKIIERIGSAHAEAEIASLVQVAKIKIAGDQQELDLEIPLSADTATAKSAAAPAGPVVTGSSSQLLWNVLEDAYASDSAP